MHVDDMIGGGNETFNRVMTAVRKEFDFGSWDIGNFRFLIDYASQKIKQIVLSTTVAELYSFMKCFGSCQFLR